MHSDFPTGELDVAIIGGGIIGCSAACYAARAGMRVALFDKGAIGFEQSTRNWGWVHQQVRHPHLIPLAIQSLGLWRELEQDLGADLEWRQGGNFNFASSNADLEAFERYRVAAVDAGLVCHLLNPGETASLLPGLDAGYLGALHVPSDGQANPHRVTRAFANAAKAAGAAIVENCAVTSVITSKHTGTESGADARAGSVTGIMTEHGSIRAPQVVIAAGAWTRRLLQPLGISIPQSSIRSTVVRTTPAAPLTSATGWAKQVAFRQDARGRFILAAGERSIVDLNLDALTDWLSFGRSALRNRGQLKLRVGAPLLRDLSTRLSTGRSSWARVRVNEPPPDQAAAAPNLAGLRTLFPRLENLAVEKIWAGNIDMTPDQAPVLDLRTHIDGLLIATGFSGHGFALGPAGGQAVAELLGSMPATVDLHPFRLARFAENDLAPQATFHPR